jgi:LytS/YehU family sensor histidine kinase
MKRDLLLKVTYSGVSLALCMVLPFITAGIPEVGNMLSPMHLPVLLCGAIAGPYFGGAVGFIAPILRSITFGMPAPLFPRAVTMAVELLGYGVVMGLARPLFKKKFYMVYPSLILAMIVGRVAGGLFKWVIFAMGLLPKYSIGIFFTGYFVEGVLGMVIQVLLIPPLIYAIGKSRGALK